MIAIIASNIYEADILGVRMGAPERGPNVGRPPHYYDYCYYYYCYYCYYYYDYDYSCYYILPNVGRPPDAG